MRSLILGGARSGKSRLAERWAAQTASQNGAIPRQVYYLATAEVRDAEMRARVARHQADRPAHWQTVETGARLSAAVRAHDAPGRVLLIDCLTLWLARWLCDDTRAAAWPAEREDFLSAWQCAQGAWFVVSNEVGSGVVPLGPLSRQFVDEAGRLHQALAADAERVALVVAGLPCILKGAAC